MGHLVALIQQSPLRRVDTPSYGMSLTPSYLRQRLQLREAMTEPLDVLEAAIPRAVVNDHERPGPSWFLGGKGLELARHVRPTVQDRQYDADGDDQAGATSSLPRYPVSRCPRQPHRS